MAGWGTLCAAGAGAAGKGRTDPRAGWLGRPETVGTGTGRSDPLGHAGFGVEYSGLLAPGEEERIRDGTTISAPLDAGWSGPTEIRTAGAELLPAPFPQRYPPSTREADTTCSV